MSGTRDALREVEGRIRSGSCNLIIGEMAAVTCKNLNNTLVPTIEQAIDEFAKGKQVSLADFATQSEAIEYFNRNPLIISEFSDFCRTTFTVRQFPPYYSILGNLSWERVFSFDVTNFIDLLFRRPTAAGQQPRFFFPSQPITKKRSSTDQVEIIRMYGNALAFEEPSLLNDGNYDARWKHTPWCQALHVELETGTTIVLGGATTATDLVQIIRKLRPPHSRHQLIFVSDKLSEVQTTLLADANVEILPLSIERFLKSIAQVFPEGRHARKILEEQTGLSNVRSEILDVVGNSFSSVNDEFFDDDASSSRYDGSIARFYRGEAATWSDVTSGITADLGAYGSLRTRIRQGLAEDFPWSTMYLLESPSGMGKSIGLMGTAYWLRQEWSGPILWLESDGDLKSLLLRLKKDDFQSGVFIFIDDIANHIDSFDDISPTSYRQICFIATSRERRFRKYATKIPPELRLERTEISTLIRSDAEEIYGKIEKYGTTIYFEQKKREARIREILHRSQRDMLILILELGQGRKFHEIIKSEMEELEEHEAFAHSLVCVTDRVQVPLPFDLFSLAFRSKYEDKDPRKVCQDLGKLLKPSKGWKTLSSRHSTIASYIINSRRKVLESGEIANAIRALLRALTNFQVPIIVYHSNTGHARVFKTITNSKFLTDVVGHKTALGLYQEFEKPFESDGFFWQQYGLCLIQGGDYEAGIPTLEHAFAVHDHFQIRHSLGAGYLSACAKLGRKKLGSAFDQYRAWGRDLLRELHSKFGHRDDLPIATLSELDLEVARKSESWDDELSLIEQYQKDLAVYLRAHPGSLSAKASYDKVFASLQGVPSTSVSTLDLEEIFSDEG